MPAPLYSEQFWIAYHKAVTGIVECKDGAGASKTVKGTFDDLIARYYGSAGFASKAVATQRNYRSVLEPFRKKHGNKPVALVEPVHLDAILGDIAKNSTSSAHNLRKRMFLIFRLAVKWGFRTDNPMLLVDRVQHKARGYETWTEDDIVKFCARWKEGTPQRIAFEILLYTGLRRSDAVRLGPPHIQGDHIVITTRKTGAEVTIPLHPRFRAVLETIKHQHLVFIATERGAARSEFAFTNWIIDAAKEAGLPPHRSPHGLRKAACVRLADAGCDVFEIMAITGHADIKEVQTYVAAANKKKKAQSAITKAYGAA
ncbi:MULTISPECIES: tyrosine-type recombinase/integrase [unclassified Aurantimonas]|uniref:tyrosine-type recombinase/integrase n=1 Tax=unclassified Aurantimonas TaxID=2638230 RepID=UPI002E179A3D|nr:MULTISPECIES: tyrosine-type recombinase/integrase [unclassified Aurantimonas]MEC5291298.1 tyrosine-type recombinase/integrase [Aurantimonas sp. C2-3-R2]MEC5412331.1 tyrosine-type recombinase/integrase [Aurantimonas sp. C2-4-R8]